MQVVNVVNSSKTPKMWEPVHFSVYHVSKKMTPIPHNVRPSARCSENDLANWGNSLFVTTPLNRASALLFEKPKNVGLSRGSTAARAAACCRC